MRQFHYKFHSVAVVMALFGTAGCIDSLPADDDNLFAATISITEGFETGSKTSYAATDVTLGTGTWNLNDALIGSTASDVKTGTKAGRLRGNGHLTMRFDHVTGASTVTVHHAKFGSDAAGSWGLFASRDQGRTWTQVGSAIATTTRSFATATFTVNASGKIRFDLRKLDGGANRIDIDDVTISDFVGGRGGGAGASLSKHTTLGIPSPTSTSDPRSFLSVKSGYVLSYNSDRKVPNWVSWELDASELGSVNRQDDFRPDDTLPANLPQAALADYVNSGFDRGHMCPSGDRTQTIAANSQTFLLSNMVPQAANNNRGPWEELEAECRNLAGAGKQLFIVAGGAFSNTSKPIGSGVSVPDQTFKVVVVLDAGQGVSGVTANTRVIGVMMPNDDSQISVVTNWHDFRVPVDTIEAMTGDDFLSDVDPAVQAAVEARVDHQ